MKLNFFYNVTLVYGIGLIDHAKPIIKKKKKVMKPLIANPQSANVRFLLFVKRPAKPKIIAPIRQFRIIPVGIKEEFTINATLIMKRAKRANRIEIVPVTVSFVRNG